MIKILFQEVKELTASVTSRFGKLFTAKGGIGSEYVDRSFFQQWGFSSIPKENSQGIVIKQGNNITCVASEAAEGDRPLLTTEGDVAIFTATNIFVKVGADGTITIKGDGTPNSIRLGTGTLKALINEDLITILESFATIPVNIGAATAGPYPPGTFAATKTVETKAS